MRPALVVTTVALSVCAALPLRADPPPCPRSPPARGTPCASPGLRCGYGGRCGGHRARYAVCDRQGRTWRIERGPTCNPPHVRLDSQPLID
jgi:hypothetical protein